MKSTCLAAIVFAVVAGLTTSFMLTSLGDHDAIGRLVLTTMGGAVLCFIAPFWVAYCGRIPVWLAGVIASAVIIYGFDIMARACFLSGTYASHGEDQLYMLIFCIPGLLVLNKRYQEQSAKGCHYEHIDQKES